MLMQRRDVVFLFLLLFSCFPTTSVSGATLPPGEMDALQQIGNKLGKNWNYSANPCTGESGWSSTVVTNEYESNVTCSCPQNDTFCHVESIVLKGQDLQGVLPPELAKLPYLQQIDLTRNYLSGTIPAEWGSMQLVNISLLGNRITGPIPKELWNIATLTDLVLEANNLSGESAVLLQGIEKLVSIKRMRISDINGKETPFPKLDNMKRIRTLILRNCNLTGSIPDYIWNMERLKTLDLSFNMLEGTLLRAALILSNSTYFIYLTSNLLSGHLPKESKNGNSIDLSYNDFIPASTKDCQDDNINIFGSSPTENNLSGAVPPCLKDFACPKPWMRSSCD